MKLLVVVLNYKVTPLTINALAAIEPELPRVPGLKVAVCENGTGPEAEAQLRQAIEQRNWGSWVQLTAVTPNRGFTGGNNVIIRQAMKWPEPPEYFLLLNADTLIQPGAFETLVKFMDEHPKAGVAGSLLVWPDDKPQGSPFRFQGIATELDRGLRIGPISKLLSPWAICAPKQSVPHLADWVSGASMIIRRQVVEQIGPLDEGLYTYFDDIDYCLNAKRAGWETWFVPQSKVVHLEGSSTGINAANVKRRPPYWFQARRRFFLKNHGPLYTAVCDAAFLAGFSLWRLRQRFSSKPDIDPPHFLGDSFRNSVFVAGFKVAEVENPAMPRSAGA